MKNRLSCSEQFKSSGKTAGFSSLYLFYPLYFTPKVYCCKIGSFVGMPALRGYFFGVGFTFLITTRALSISVSGRRKFSSLINFPPNTWIAFPASCISSAAFPDL